MWRDEQKKMVWCGESGMKRGERRESCERTLDSTCMQQHTDGLSMVVREEPTNVHVLYSVGVWGRVCGAEEACVVCGERR